MLDREYEIMHRLERSHWWFVAKKRYIKTVLDLYLKDKGNTILDIGCGTGGMTDLLKDYGRVFGLDRHGSACELFCQTNKFSLIKGDANELPFKRGTFHLIALLDVLYHQHISDDEEVLDQVYQLLVPNGFLLITDSAFEFLKSTHDKAVMARHRYTLRELTEKLKSRHFSIERSTYLYFMIFPLVVLSRLLGKLTWLFFKPDIRSDLKETNAYLNRFLTILLGWEGKWLKRVNLPFGSSLLILGRKT